VQESPVRSKAYPPQLLKLSISVFSFNLLGLLWNVPARRSRSLRPRFRRRAGREWASRPRTTEEEQRRYQRVADLNPIWLLANALENEQGELRPQGEWMQEVGVPEGLMLTELADFCVAFTEAVYDDRERRREEEEKETANRHDYDAPD
jgi:hypothetical protein